VPPSGAAERERVRAAYNVRACIGSLDELLEKTAKDFRK
jgi:hypothetical protein